MSTTTHSNILLCRHQCRCPSFFVLATTILLHIFFVHIYSTDAFVPGMKIKRITKTDYKNPRDVILTSVVETTTLPTTTTSTSTVTTTTTRRQGNQPPFGLKEWNTNQTTTTTTTTAPTIDWLKPSAESRTTTRVAPFFEKRIPHSFFPLPNNVLPPTPERTVAMEQNDQRVSHHHHYQPEEQTTIDSTNNNNNNNVIDDDVDDDTFFSSHGMPWTKSICDDYNETNLIYMKFYEYQIQFMKESLTNVRQVPVLSKSGIDMSYMEAPGVSSTSSKNQKMRIHTVCFQCDEYKLIRLTSLDAGYRSQIFTSLWYPNPSCGPNVPLLGVDLLQFNHGKKHVCVCDFQPIQSSSSSERNSNNNIDSMDYEESLRSIRSKYPTLHNNITNRFYQSNDTYFSEHMLLGRHTTLPSNNMMDHDVVDNESKHMVYNEMYPAFQEYMNVHVNVVKAQLLQQKQQQQQKHNQQQGTTTDTNVKEQEEVVLQLYTKYDTYSAQRDPAHAVLVQMFGQEWADEYVYDILFPSSSRIVSKI